jgi:tRNA(fMet)-specific endonuclease VapC
VRYLLDTNTISNLVDFPSGAGAKRVREAAAADAQIVTSIVVVAELRFGYTKISSRRLKDAYERIFQSIAVEDWRTPFDHVYGEIRSMLEKRGSKIGAMDMLIASHALATDAVVVTGNEREFCRVPGLKIENWLRAEPAE